MINKYCNKIFNLLLVTLLLSSNLAYTINNPTQSSNITVGLLEIEKETYPYELEKICEIFNNFRVKTILIDYNKLINLKKINEESLHFAKQDKVLAKKLALDRIKIKVEEFIKEKNINRIFIFGNYHTEPSPCHQLVTEAIMKIVDDNPSIHLLGKCESIMNTNMVHLIKNEKKQKFHLKPAPNLKDISLQQIKIIPNSHLAEIVSKFLIPNENGWFSTYFPNSYTETVNNNPENRRKLELLGYKVVGFSNNGSIEAIEDKHGNIYFQSHPEALVIQLNKNFLSPKQKTSTLVAISIIHDFLYRIN